MTSSDPAFAKRPRGSGARNASQPDPTRAPPTHAIPVREPPEGVENALEHPTRADRGFRREGDAHSRTTRISSLPPGNEIIVPSRPSVMGPE